MRPSASDPFEPGHQVRQLINHLEQEVCTRLSAIEKKLERLAKVEAKLDRLGGLDVQAGAPRKTDGHCVERGKPSGFELEQRTQEGRSPPQEAQDMAGQDVADMFSPRESHFSIEESVHEAYNPSPPMCASPVRGPSSASLAMQVAKSVLVKNSSRGWVAQCIWHIMEPEAGDGSRGWFARWWPVVSMVGFLFAFVQELQTPLWRSVWVVTWDFGFDGLFTLEVLLRFLVCPDRFAFFSSLFNYIDLAAGPAALTVRTAAVLPRTSNNSDGRLDLVIFLSIATPVLRLLKLLRRFEKFHLLLSAFQIALGALPVLLFTLLLIILVFSAGIYWCEPRDNIESLPSAMWLTVVTMTTVGYGDQVPKSSAGYLIVSLLMVFSALYMAMPIGIVGSAFNRVWEDRERLLLLQRFRVHLAQKGYSARDIPDLFLLFDEDKDGQLSVQEFEQMMSAVQLGIHEERVAKLFSLFDCNGKGSISDAMLLRLLFPQTFREIYGQLQYKRAVVAPPKEEPRRRSKEGVPVRRSAVTELDAFRSSVISTGPCPAPEVINEQSSTHSEPSSSESNMQFTYSL